MPFFLVLLILTGVQADAESSRVHPPVAHVFMKDLSQREMKEVAAKWGPAAALEVIEHTKTIPHYHYYKAIRLLDALNTPETREFLLSEAEAAIAAKDINKLISLGRSVLISAKKAQIDAVLIDRFYEIAAAPQWPRDTYHLMYYLGEAAHDILVKEAAEHPNPVAREKAGWAVSVNTPSPKRMRAQQKMESVRPPPEVRSIPPSAPVVMKSYPGESVIRGKLRTVPGKRLAPVWVYLSPDCGSEGVLTNEQGEFELPYSSAGTPQFRVHGFIRFGLRSYSLETVVLDAPSLELVPGTTYENIEIQVKQEDYLITEDHFIKREGQSRSVVTLPGNIRPAENLLGGGRDYSDILLRYSADPPCWLEFTSSGYVPRLLPVNLYPLRAWGSLVYQIRLRNLSDALQYGLNRSHVNGSFWSCVLLQDGAMFDEDVAELPAGEVLLARKAWYEAVASARDDFPTLLPPRPAPETFTVKVIDSRGNPVTRIQLLPLAWPDAAQQTTWDWRVINAIGRRDFEKEYESLDRESGSGVYPLGRFEGFLTAEGMSREYVQTPVSLPQQPHTVMLFPESSIRIEMPPRSREFGRSLVMANNIDYRNRHLVWQNPVLFPKVAPGAYHFAFATNERLEQRSFTCLTDAVFIRVDVRPGQELHVEKTWPLPEEGLEGLWHEWRYNKNLDEVTEVDLSLKEQLAPYLKEEWHTIPVQLEQAFDVVMRLAALTKILGTSDIIPTLKQCVLLIPPFRNSSYFSDFSPMRALISLDGDDIIDWLKENTVNPVNPYNIRLDCLMALGVLGTPKSVAAFVELRDAAFALPGAPAPQTEYTHGEKMVEAAVMTFEIIPGPPPFPRVKTDYLADYATVDETGENGTLSYSTYETAPGIALRRFGNEWLVAGFLPGC